MTMVFNLKAIFTHIQINVLKQIQLLCKHLGWTNTGAFKDDKVAFQEHSSFQQVENTLQFPLYLAHVVSSEWSNYRMSYFVSCKGFQPTGYEHEHEKIGNV